MQDIKIIINSKMAEGMAFCDVKSGDTLKLTGPHMLPVYVYVKQNWHKDCGNLTTVRLDDLQTRYITDSCFIEPNRVRRVKAHLMVSE